MEKFTVPNLPCNPKETDWRYFIRQFNNYLTIIDAKEAQKLPLLINSLGRDGIDIFDGLPEPKSTYQDTIDRFEAHFKGRISVLLLRKQFYEARQQHKESSSDFACRIRRMSKECQFGTYLETMQRDIFVVGIRDDRLGERLLAESASTLTFDAALARAEAYERARTERSAVAGHSSSVNSTAKFTHTKSRKDEGKRDKGSRIQRPTEIQRSCYRCGSKDHLANSSLCRGKNVVCNNCSKLGHFASVCRANVHVTIDQKPRKTVHAISNDIDDSIATDVNDSKMYNIFASYPVKIYSNRSSDSPLNSLIRTVHIDGKSLDILIDTGSEHNVIPKYCIDQCTSFVSTDNELKAVGKFPLQVVGMADLRILYGNKSTIASFLVIEDELSFPLFSYQLCLELGMMYELVPKVAFTCSACFAENDYSDIFEGIGTLTSGYQYKLRVTENITPFSPPARRLPAAIMPKFEIEINRLIDSSIIEPVTDPTDICSPTVVVYKKTGDIRIVTDMRHLNKFVLREQYPIPTFDELAQTVINSKVFTKLDFRSGFFQIPVDPDSRQYLTFSTPLGRFRYRKLPMGLVSAPEVFMRILSDIFGDIDGVLVYFDDLVIHSDNEENHKRILTTVFERIRQNGLKLNKEKCTFLSHEIEFLGHIWSSDGIKLSSEKVNSIERMPKPSSKQSLRSFLGLAGYLGQKSVPHYSTLVQPLWEMIKSDRFHWTAKAEQAFSNLKDLICKENCRAYFDPRKKTVVQTDSSGEGLGAVLIQDKRPVIFVSRMLTATEKKYSQIEREFLGIVFGLTRLRQFLIGIHFDLETDNKPIVQLSNKPIDVLSNRLQRWLVAIQHYDLKFKHISASENILADALSRNSVPGTPTECENAEYTLCFVLKSAPINLKAIAEATAEDDELCQVAEQVQQHWKSYKGNLKPYYRIKDELCLKECKGLFVMCRGSRVIIPECLREEMLTIAHESHAGMSKMKTSLRSHCFWPRMHADIENFVRRCSACTIFQTRTDNPPLKTISDDITKPWNTIAIDLTGPSEILDGKVLLTIIDLQSRYPEAFILRDGSTTEIISKLRNVFARFGFCEYLKSDNGTVFVSQQFTEFLKSIGVKHVTSPVYYPQGNSCVERFHSTLKSRLKRIRQSHNIPLQQALDCVLFDVRSSANDVTGESPYFRLFGREMSTKLSLTSVGDFRVVGRKRNLKEEYLSRKAVNKHYEPGQTVFVRKLVKEPYKYEGKIIKRVGNHNYEVEVNGRRSTYNQSNLKLRFDTDTDNYFADLAYDDVCRTSSSNPKDSPFIPRRSSRVRKQPIRFCHDMYLK